MKKTVLVTGSSVGIGSSLIEEFAKNDYNVVINYLTHEKEAFELEKKVKEKYNVDSLCIKCDISNEDNIKMMFNKIIKKFNKIDVLVNNAGICMDNDFNKKTKEEFLKVLEVNLVGTFLISRIIGNSMYENKNGNIINISSTNGINTYNDYSIDYDASKSGIINLSHNLAKYYSPYVKVNTICPGWVITDSVKEMNPNILEKEKEKILLNRFATPEEISKTIVFITSNDLYINDSVIRIDGGYKC